MRRKKMWSERPYRAPNRAVKDETIGVHRAQLSVKEGRARCTETHQTPPLLVGMPFHAILRTCPYCNKRCKTSTGLLRHYAQKLQCGSKRQQSYKQQAEAHHRPWRQEHLHSQSVPSSQCRSDHPDSIELEMDWTRCETADVGANGDMRDEGIAREDVLGLAGAGDCFRVARKEMESHLFEGNPV